MQEFGWTTMAKWRINMQVKTNVRAGGGGAMDPNGGGPGMDPNG